jgi:hypothetical protein
MLRSWKAGAVTTALGAIAILGGGGSTAEARGDLVVKRFLVGRLEPNTDRFIATGGRGTQNVHRDCVVMLVFSRPLDLSRTVPGNSQSPFVHINDRTFRIGIPAGPGLFIQAEGSYYQYVLKQFDPQQGFVPKRAYRNRVFFDPTKRFDDPSVRTPYGFDANSLFSVEVPGLDTGETKTVRTPEGDYNSRTFSTTFRTTAKYLQDYTQPRIVTVESNDAPGVPLDGRTSVDSKADVIAKFSEPMLPAAFDPSTTFTVTITSPGTPRLVSGVIRASPDGTAFTFRPVFGYGQGPATVRVNLAPTLSDRSGNVVDKGAVVNFTSEFDPTAQQYGEIVEEFDDPADSDWTSQAVYDRASWNGWIGPPPTPQNNTNKNQGQLAGVFGAKSLDIVLSTSASGHGIPWWNAQSHTQNLYSAGMMGGTPRSISDFKWRYYQVTAAIGVSYPGTTVMLGHNTAGGLSTSFSGSFSDTPVTMFNNQTYTIPTSDIEWVSGPKFTTTWPYNGKDGVVLDISTANGSGSSVNYWRYTPTGQGGTTMIRAYSGGAPQGLTYNHDVRFLFLVDRSEAQSRWYDTSQNSVNWLDPIVTQAVPPGTVVSLVFQGALENPNQPGTPDVTTLTAWSADPLEDLGGNRFIRFHVDFTSNLGSSTKPTIDQIKIPFVYF